LSCNSDGSEFTQNICYHPFVIAKSYIKEIMLLQQKKYRKDTGLFVAQGVKIVKDLLSSDFHPEGIFATKDFLTENEKIISGISERDIHKISNADLERISSMTSPNQVVAVFHIKVLMFDSRVAGKELVLALDDIRDPGNLGTIIRTADWFGIKDVVCSETCSDIYNSKSLQATMGSIARVNVYYTDLSKLFSSSEKDQKIFAAVIDGKNIYTDGLSKAGYILIGNEANGISSGLMKYVTNKIAIPGFSSGANSLNAAMATAIICSEFKRRG